MAKNNEKQQPKVIVRKAGEPRQKAPIEPEPKTKSEPFRLTWAEFTKGRGRRAF